MGVGVWYFVETTIGKTFRKEDGCLEKWRRESANVTRYGILAVAVSYA